MANVSTEELAASGVVLLLAGIAPNIFPAAQAGLAKMSVLGARLLIPSIALLGVTGVVAQCRGHRRLVRRIIAGAGAGFIATFGLEAVRLISFHVFEGMPGDLPRLMGVLLTDRFMLGPSPASDVIGWMYHFWNGACFGIIFAVLFGRRSIAWALLYAQVVGIGFLMSPAVKALGIGFMGMEMPTMPETVVLAHAVYGLALGVLCRRWLKDDGWLLCAPMVRP